MSASRSATTIKRVGAVIACCTSARVVSQRWLSRSACGRLRDLPAFGCRMACPDGLLHQAERDAIEGCRQRGMDFQPFAAGVIEVAQTSGMRMRGIQELGGVLEHQHRIVVLDTAARWHRRCAARMRSAATCSEARKR